MDKLGQDILNNPRLNKGTGFTEEERTRYGLHGLLPSRISTFEQQQERALANVRRQETDIDKYIFLSSLHKRNERLYYRLLIDHTTELMPVVYTPTVGQACLDFAQLFTQTSGFYISIKDKGNIDQLLDNWPETDVRMIVVTDGERILGLGDLGTNGMGIPIGKLALYCALAGIRPEHCLPIMLDVGTDNEELRNNEIYLGLRQARVRGQAYDDFIEEFVQAIKKNYPRAVLQFEDFATQNAITLLERYQDQLLCFNDDIQGTASVVLAGLYASTRLTETPLADMRFMFLGAGSAATGIGELLIEALKLEGLSHDQAVQRLVYFDRKGLVSKERDNVSPHIAHMASDLPVMSLEETIHRFRPHVLIGATGSPKTFTEEMLRAMATVNQAPVIFALSNPTTRAECTAEEAYHWTDGRAVFASGSPFGVVHIHGDIKVPGQGNNAYIFPGLGLGALGAESKRINDKMLIASAKTLAESVSDNQLEQGCLYPPLSDIREVSLQIALAVAREACKAGYSDVTADAAFEQKLRDYQYDPRY
jgi:malate dehydrogenase (oxaloacetate-decarboxylating)(NADP+)